MGGELQDDDEASGEGDVKNSQAMINHSLLRAARDGDLAGIRRALGRGAYIETRRPFIMTPEPKVQGGRTTAKKRGTGLTPLMYASQGGYKQACELLLASRAAIDAQDEDGFQSLHFAATSGSQETCILLLQRGALAGAKDDEGRVPADHVPQDYLSTAADQKRWAEVFETQPLSAEELEEDMRGSVDASIPELVDRRRLKSSQVIKA